MEEVVEHLDPGPLGLLPAALLQGLRPRTLVLTTPNAEYNGILYALGGRAYENGFRNSDHRFEWCAHPPQLVGPPLLVHPFWQARLGLWAEFHRLKLPSSCAIPLHQAAPTSQGRSMSAAL